MAGSSCTAEAHAGEEIMQQHLRLTPDEHRLVRHWLLAITIVYAFLMLVVVSLVIVKIDSAASGADPGATAMQQDASPTVPSPDARRPPIETAAHR
jgi:hypothetical protein